jgi:hypothetical protein
MFLSPSLVLPFGVTTSKVTIDAATRTDVPLRANTVQKKSPLQARSYRADVILPFACELDLHPSRRKERARTTTLSTVKGTRPSLVANEETRTEHTTQITQSKSDEARPLPVSSTLRGKIRERPFHSEADLRLQLLYFPTSAPHKAQTFTTSKPSGKASCWQNMTRENLQLIFFCACLRS